MHTLKWPRTVDAPIGARSAAVAKRRLHDTLPIDRGRTPARRDSAEQLLSLLLQEDLGPRERRSA